MLSTRALTLILALIYRTVRCGEYCGYRFRSDESCSVKCQWVGLYQTECVNSASKVNFGDIIQEVRGTGLAYDLLYITLHNFGSIENVTLSDISIKRIQIIDNDIEFISDEVFDSMTKCIEINLASNKLTDVVNINAPLLTRLDFTLNSYRRVSQRMFTGIPMLKYLSFASNQISEIEENAFQGLINLTSVGLNDNLIKILPDDVFSRLGSLADLDLQMNCIQEIKPSYFQDLQSLKRLDLGFNKIRKVNNKSFVYLPNLIYLSLKYTLLDSLEPSVFQSLGQLKELYLDSNLIESLSDNVFQPLKQLHELSLDDNLVVDMCYFLKNTGLSREVLTIRLVFNDLYEIPSNCFQTFPNLEDLFLSRNHINHIYENAFAGVEKKLGSILLYKNKLQLIKSYYFRGLVALYMLDLSRNQISVIEKGSFDGLISLNDLNLENNCIYELDWTLFARLSNMRDLNLSRNLIAVLYKSDTMPINFTNLYRLDFNFNYLGEFEAIKSDIYPELKKLRLRSNRLSRFSWNLKNQVFEELDLSANDHMKYLDLSGVASIDHIDLSSIISNYETQLISDTVITSLNLNQNHLQNVYNISGLLSPGLEKLYVNYVDGLDPDYLFRLIKIQTKLKKLEMRGADLSGSLGFFANIRGLVDIDLSDGRISDMGRFIAQMSLLSSLSSLKLENIGLESLDILSASMNWSLLVQLDLDNNKLTCLKKSHLESTKNLSILSMKNNLIDFIENGTLKSLRSLSYIDLRNNSLIYLEPLNNRIEYFGIAINRMTIIPDYRIFRLATMDFSFNQLTDIAELKAYANDVCYSNNKIREIQNTSFLYIFSTSSLMLDRNEIETIQPFSFLKLYNLSFMNMSQNRLRYLNQSTFSGLIRLNNLDLSMNQLEKLTQDMFADLIYLEKLDLRGNQLKSIEDFTFGEMLLLEQLFISRNPEVGILTEQKLRGIENWINYLDVDSTMMAEISSLEFLSTFFHIRSYNRQTMGRHLYYSMDIVYYKYSSLTSWDCFSTLYLIKYNVKLNIFIDKMVERYLTDCQAYFNQLIR